FLDQRRATQTEKPRGMSNGAAGTSQRLFDQTTLDGEKMLAKVETFLRQYSQRLRAENRTVSDDGQTRTSLEDVQHLVVVERDGLIFHSNSLRRIVESADAERAVQRGYFELPVNRRPILRRQVSDVYDASRADNRKPFDQIPQLANVAGPGAQRQRTECTLRE